MAVLQLKVEWCFLHAMFAFQWYVQLYWQGFWCTLSPSHFRHGRRNQPKFANNEKTSYHQCSLQSAEQLVHSVEHPKTNLPALFSSRRADNIARNRGILKFVASAVLFCAKQCIALRGYAEQLDTPGNFLAVLKLLAVNDQELHQHLQSPAMRNVTHMSPQTHNELIEVMGKHIVLRNIVDELKAARWYAILADEVTSHNTEHLAICARFVDQNNDIREEFLGLHRFRQNYWCRDC